MKTKKVLVTLLLIIIVVAASVAGYLFAKNDRPDTKTHPATKSSSKAPTTRQADYEGQLVTSATKKFSLIIPNGWQTVVNCTNNDIMFVGDADQTILEYKKDIPPTIEGKACGDDAPKVFFAAANQADKVEQAKAATKSFQTAAGLEGTKICEDNVSSGGLTQRIYLQQCTYRFEKSGMVYSLTYSRPDATYLDRVDLIDKVAKSFSVLQ